MRLTPQTDAADDLASERVGLDKPACSLLETRILWALTTCIARDVLLLFELSQTGLHGLE